MQTAVVLSAFMAVAAAAIFPPVDQPSSCISTLCLQGTTCREVLNQSTGVVQGQCLTLVPVSGNEEVCGAAGNPLLVDRGDGNVREATCGSFRDRINCPSGYSCTLGAFICCPVDGGLIPVEKPGTCPASKGYGQVGICASTCQQDSDCKGTDKCCPNPCGATTCQSVEEPRPSCNTVKCGPGQKCELQQFACVRAPCHPQPVCVDVKKPGVCPRPRYSLFRLYCHHGCQSDAECPGAQKCCKTFCGSRCRDPEQPTLTCRTVDCKPDYVCVMKQRCDRSGCFRRPVCEPVKRCPFYPAWVNPHCKDRCSEHDPKGCSSGTICCATDCGRRCVKPLP